MILRIFFQRELSNLRVKKSNSTNTFNEVQQLNCVIGSYQRRLLDLWQQFDEAQVSENDCPDVFPSNQLFIILHLANGGNPMETFMFNNAMQAYAVFEQVNYLKFCSCQVHYPYLSQVNFIQTHETIYDYISLIIIFRLLLHLRQQKLN